MPCPQKKKKKKPFITDLILVPERDWGIGSNNPWARRRFIAPPLVDSSLIAGSSLQSLRTYGSPTDHRRVTWRAAAAAAARPSRAWKGNEYDGQGWGLPFFLPGYILSSTPYIMRNTHALNNPLPVGPRWFLPVPYPKLITIIMGSGDYGGFSALRLNLRPSTTLLVGSFHSINETAK